MKQSNKQTVFFKDAEGQWFKNQINLKKVYTNVHSAGTKYGSSADMLVYEMTANLLELIKEGKIDLKKGLTITDYGCGKSTAANVVGKVFASNRDFIIEKLIEEGVSLSEVMEYLMPVLKQVNSLKEKLPMQTELYDLIKVQRFDIGIKEFSSPLKERADVVFCNDVFEHIPYEDLPAFVSDLQAAGRYIFASISLRDAVNYSPLKEEVVFKGAKKSSEPTKGAIILKQDPSGAYIFSLHVSVLPKATWQKILGKKWHLLTAQDYTACSAMNFQPSTDYQAYKKDLIAKVGFADFIAFPTPVRTRYESDPILFRRVAEMQPAKHVMKLATLEEYPESEFKTAEKEKSEAFLKFIGLKPAKNGRYHLSRLPKGYLKKLYKLEEKAKMVLFGNEDTETANREVAEIAEELIAEYNNGCTEWFD